MDEQTRHRKVAAIDAPHVAPLNDLVRQWRTQGRHVPWFDPDGGGTGATVLLLMESPGPRTIAAGTAAITTEDNPDPTARHLRTARIEAELAATACLRWNVIPWALPTGHKPTIDDLEDARPALAQVSDLLHSLHVVITFGTAALNGWMRHLTLTQNPRLVPTLAVPHPSPANGHRRAETHQRILNALRSAAGTTS